MKWMIVAKALFAFMIGLTSMAAFADRVRVPIKIEPLTPAEECAQRNGSWDPITEQCFDTLYQLCVFRNFSWSEYLNNCFEKPEDLLAAERDACTLNGDIWDSSTNQCLYTLDAIECRDRGGVWDFVRRSCSVDSRANDVYVARTNCLASGFFWEETRQVCLESLDAIECHDMGGIWKSDTRECVFLVPDPNV